MAWRWLYKLLGRDLRGISSHRFSEDDRDRSHISRLEGQIRKQRIDFLKEKLQRMKQVQEEEMLESQVSDLESDIYGEEEEEMDNASGDKFSPDSILTSMFVRAMQNPQKEAVDGATKGRINLSNEQIEEYKKKVPDHILKRARKMNDEEMLTFVRGYNPSILENYDDDTIRRALDILRR